MATLSACPLRVAAFGLYKYDTSKTYQSRPGPTKTLDTIANMRLKGSSGSQVNVIGGTLAQAPLQEYGIFTADLVKGAIAYEVGAVPVAGDYVNWSIEFTKNTIGGNGTAVTMAHVPSVSGLARLWVAFQILPVCVTGGTMTLDGQVNVIRRVA